jgi:hypothetical protein
MDEHAIAQTYFAKMFITPAARQNPTADSWALFTINGLAQPKFGHGTVVSPALDLKFVQRIQHPYQFSVNSLQIVLPDFEKLDKSRRLEDVEHVDVLCAYGALDEVVEHINHRVIAVRSHGSVLSIHGGGLLKYAALRAQGYTLSPHLDRTRLEHFMLRSFLQDFLGIQMQRTLDYMDTHMRMDGRAQYNFVQELSAIITRLASSHAASEGLVKDMTFLNSIAMQFVWTCRDYWLHGSATKDCLKANPVPMVKMGDDSAAGSICSSPPSSVRGQHEPLDKESGAHPTHYDSGAVSDASSHTDDESAVTTPHHSPRFGGCQPAGKGLGDVELALKRLSEITNCPLATGPTESR